MKTTNIKTTEEKIQNHLLESVTVSKMEYYEKVALNDFIDFINENEDVIYLMEEIYIVDENNVIENQKFLKSYFYNLGNFCESFTYEDRQFYLRENKNNTRVSFTVIR